MSERQIWRVWEVRNMLMKMSCCHLGPDVRVRTAARGHDLV